MKTAVIISGQTRTFCRTFRTLDWCLFRKLENPVFFCSVADDRQAPDIDLLRQRYEHVHVEYVTQPTDFPMPDRELGAHAGWIWHAPREAILRQLWALGRAYAFFREKAGPSHAEFDWIVRCRPDLWAQEIILPAATTDGWTPQAGLPIAANECWTPWWATYGGVNDRMAIMGPTAALHYFGTFTHREKLWEIGCPLHPETMLKASMEMHGVKIFPKLRAEFRICRFPDAEHPDPWLVKEQTHPHEFANLILG